MVSACQAIDYCFRVIYYTCMFFARIEMFCAVYTNSLHADKLDYSVASVSALAQHEGLKAYMIAFLPAYNFLVAVSCFATVIPAHFNGWTTGQVKFPLTVPLKFTNFTVYLRVGQSESANWPSYAYTDYSLIGVVEYKKVNLKRKCEMKIQFTVV